VGKLIMDLLLEKAKEKAIVKNITEMLKKTNKFSQKNALMYGIVNSSTYYYVILGILRKKGLINFRAGVPYIDKKKWNEFLSQYNQEKIGFFYDKPIEIPKTNFVKEMRFKINSKL
jgi:hypothetical protein